ncbi:hypothetical protein N8J89_18255 [Crossiella sp. CA-258035]|uniref:hypothetical protein n=1 Tax=Crossiella sp. CA-258035 TaxID=2981138 RepID=UPI0024BD4BC2|nr:hypothetical protein [Crossiella sp. CA-258035]WHT22936.1 hypothetical protein N8J89_18255 [Crossiella sp. CA-258035]
MAWRFLALRWRVLRNSFADGAGGRVAFLVLGGLLGLFLAVQAIVLLAGAGGATPEGALLRTALIEALITVLWLLVPLLYGVDETLQPVKFALLPLTRRQLTTGFLTAALVSVPTLVTLLATSGTIIAASAHGVAAVLVAVLGVLLGLAVCLVGSRALTTAFARLLTSRVARDLATVVVFLVAAGAWLAWVTLNDRLFTGTWDGWLPAARVLAWTPLAAPYSAWWDLAHGHALAALAKLLIGLVAVLLLGWWWGRMLASAMTGGRASGGSGQRAGAAGGELVPRWLRRVLPSSPAGAVVARTLRMWVRDTRFRIALITYLVIPVALAVTWRSAPVEVVTAITGCAVGLGVANAFGYDGPAYATHLLAAVPGRDDLRARIIANAVLAVPAVLVAAVALGLLREAPAAILPALGTGLAAFGSAAALATILSARVPYVPAPPDKPFATPPGGQAQPAITAYGALLGGMALAAPVLLVALLVPGGSWLALPLGVAWAGSAAEAGAALGGRRADRHGPEILLAVTPRR